MGWAHERWPAILERWEAAVAARGKTAGSPLCQPPATESEIQALEARLGYPLPPSYRTFLQTSNGLKTIGFDPTAEPADEYLPASRVYALRNRGDPAETLWLTRDRAEATGLFDIEGNVAEQLLEPQEYSLRGHLLYAVKIGGPYPEGSVLLDPLDVDADGEWRAWDCWKETCIKDRSFGDLIERTVANDSAPEEPSYYRHVKDPSPAAQERLRLETELEAGGAAAERAVQRLAEMATMHEDAVDRAPAMWVLLHSKSGAAQEAVLRLVESRPDDPVVVGNALQNGLGRQHTARVRKGLWRALMGPHGDSYASSLYGQWPELVEEAWTVTQDPAWLHHLLFWRRPGSLQPSIDALADPSLPSEDRFTLSYTLSHATRGHPDAPQPEAVRRLAAVKGNDPLHLARALLGWDQVDMALSLLRGNLEQGQGTDIYLFMELQQMAPPAAVPILIESLHRKPSAPALHTLGCIDHPDSAPELGRHLDGPLRLIALLALEQLANPQALSILADRAVGGDVDAARALARRRDERCLEPLIRMIGGPHHRKAVTGLRDLRHPRAEDILARVVTADQDDNVAVIAAHGLVMAKSKRAGDAAKALSRRADPHVKKLADHWLELLRSG